MAEFIIKTINRDSAPSDNFFIVDCLGSAIEEYGSVWFEENKVGFYSLKQFLLPLMSFYWMRIKNTPARSAPPRAPD